MSAIVAALMMFVGTAGFILSACLPARHSDISAVDLIAVRLAGESRRLAYIRAAHRYALAGYHWCESCNTHHAGALQFARINVTDLEGRR